MPPSAEPGSPDRRSRRILWVTDEPPDRALGGGNIRQAHLFEALASAFPTDLLVAGRVSDERVRAAAANVIEVNARRAPETQHPVGRRLLALAITMGSAYPARIYPAGPGRRALAGHLRDAASAYDLVCIEHEALAPLIPDQRAAPWIITFHHLLSGMIEEESRLARHRRQRWYQARDLAKARRMERRALSDYDCCLVCSDDDAAVLGAAGPPGTGGRVSVVPNGVDLTAFPPGPVPSKPGVLLPGTLDWGPNIDGATWFGELIWPQVRAAVPEATLTLAGRSPVAEVRRLERLPGVSLHADVPSMVPFFQSARVVVVPLRVGTGTRIKALEAMAAARPVVGTTIGLAGLGATDGTHLRIADSAAAMARAVIDVLTCDDVAEPLARAGRALVEERFGWDRIGSDFVAMVSETIERSARTQPARSSSRAA
jgi:glycosyltransferase involved in cell wall biosynthesis